MESIESERSSPATMTAAAAAAVHSAKRLLTMDLRRSVSALKKSLSNIVLTGAGATFDWLFFDNSKVINFDD